jgi:hypothetical protein
MERCYNAGHQLAYGTPRQYMILDVKLELNTIDSRVLYRRVSARSWVQLDPSCCTSKSYLGESGQCRKEDSIQAEPGGCPAIQALDQSGSET